jgi:hypothetical protein
MQAGGFVWPVSGFTVSQPYGHNGHPGIDLAVPVGTPVGSTAGGVVSVSGMPDPSGYGNQIDVQHLAGYMSRYGHLSALLARVGQAVTQLQQIGRSGGQAGAPGSGNATGPHLHFEIRLNGRTLDPAQLVSGGGGPVLDLAMPNVPGPGSFGPGIPAMQAMAMASVMQHSMQSVLTAARQTAITRLANQASPDGGGPTGPLPAATGPYQAYAASLMAAYGWGPSEMAALIPLWMRESGWNPNARNPSSGAYGIPQALGHGDIGSDPYGQIRWGLTYIKGRYGSPSAAWAHELATGWYEHGGLNFLTADSGVTALAPGLNMVYNGLGRVEKMVSTDHGHSYELHFHAPVYGEQSMRQAINDAMDESFTTLGRAVRTQR